MDFSVSMCVYNGDNPEWFELAVNSVINQTVKPSEIVIVVDGAIYSELDSVINRFSENPIVKIVRLPENRGHGEARRIGLQNCSNDIVAIMDADDISANDRFEKQIAYFVDGDIDIVGGNITEFIDDESNIIGKRLVPKNDDEIKEYLKYRCPMNLVTVMFKKSSVISAGGFIDWYCEEDYYLWIRMMQQGMVFANCDDFLVNVRVGKDMYGRRGGIKYFKSEAKLQKLMLNEKIISFPIFLSNIIKRFIVQVLLPNSLRAYIFKKFAREN